MGGWTTQDIGGTALDENGLPALAVRVTDVNHHSHLDGLVRSHPPSFRRAGRLTHEFFLLETIERL